jgi:maltooligosyltrehalose trehalohydrolase
MPVAQFPGKRNWGYDGVNLFAPQNSYAAKNSPEELKNLINECHRQGLAIFLDVVYNHLGPEGNHLAKWGPYFQDKYRTPWGNALNFDGAHSDEVRNYFLNNAQQWIEEYHFDGLRFDAIHAIMDTSAYPFLAEVTDLIKELRQKLDRKIWTIAESDGNDPRVLQDSAGGGFGMDAQWADDFHHCMHAYLTEEKQGYYSDYGTAENLAEVFKKGTLFSGQYSKARGRRHGRSFSPEQRHRLVVCSQNHDQVGNRARGERLAHLIDENKLKAAAIWTFLFGGLPMLFMGEEIGADRPFQYFVDHTENELLTAVREGRKKEFAAFTWQGEVPDPGALSTFENSRPDWSGLESQRSREFLALHKNLTALSKKLRKSKILEDKNLNVELLNEGKVLQVRVPGFFEMLGSLTMEEQQISRTERQLPLSFSSIKNFEIGPKIKLPSFAVAVFYE